MILRCKKLRILDRKIHDSTIEKLDGPNNQKETYKGFDFDFFLEPSRI